MVFAVKEDGELGEFDIGLLVPLLYGAFNSAPAKPNYADVIVISPKWSSALVAGDRLCC
jgi:hypothetical protein